MLYTHSQNRHEVDDEKNKREDGERRKAQSASLCTVQLIAMAYECLNVPEYLIL